MGEYEGFGYDRWKRVARWGTTLEWMRLLSYHRRGTTTETAVMQRQICSPARKPSKGRRG